MKNLAVKSIICKTFYGLLLFLSPICAFSQDSGAQALYKAGMHALSTMPHTFGPKSEKHLHDAIENLSQSFEKLKNPMTAYALAYAYTLSEDSADAKIYAKKALTLEPKLSSDFSSEAQKILKWAEAAAASVDMSIQAQLAPPEPGYPINFLFKRPASTIQTKSLQK